MSNYNSFDIKVRFFDYENNDIIIPLKFKDYISLLENKENTKDFIIENNYDFLEETCLNKKIKYYDHFFKPFSLMSYEYDIIIGKNDLFTKCQYNLNYRNYFIILEGKVKLKLTPQKVINTLNVKEI